jgi:hypothetical protein
VITSNVVGAAFNHLSRPDRPMMCGCPTLSSIPTWSC